MLFSFCSYRDDWHPRAYFGEKLLASQAYLDTITLNCIYLTACSTLGDTQTFYSVRGKNRITYIWKTIILEI